MWLHPHQLWLKLKAPGCRCATSTITRSIAARGWRTNSASPIRAIRARRFPGIDYAYHFDASLLAKFLRVRAEAKGVTRIEGRIVDVKLDGESGHVDHVVLADGRTVDGDLFVDCSGMRGLLIGQALGVGYEDWSQWLLNDRALAVPCESVSPLTPYTRVTARAHGWQWRIPLQHRIGNGHVYASAQISDDEAATVLLANLDGKPLADPRPVASAGQAAQGVGEERRRDRPFLGLPRAARIDQHPLDPDRHHQADGLFPHRVSPRRTWPNIIASTISNSPTCATSSSRTTRSPIARTREYWRYLKHMSVPDSLTERLELFASSGRFFRRAAQELFREESWVQVLLGQGLPVAHDPMVEMIPEATVADFLRHRGSDRRRRQCDARSRRLHRPPLPGAAADCCRIGTARRA
jgi:tryptophan halogenase